MPGHRFFNALLFAFGLIGANMALRCGSGRIILLYSLCSALIWFATEKLPWKPEPRPGFYKNERTSGF